MLDDTKKNNDKIYKSPIKKLVTFFERSRDKWKAKYPEMNSSNIGTKLQISVEFFGT